MSCLVRSYQINHVPLNGCDSFAASKSPATFACADQNDLVISGSEEPEMGLGFLTRLVALMFPSLAFSFLPFLSILSYLSLLVQPAQVTLPCLSHSSLSITYGSGLEHQDRPIKVPLGGAGVVR